MDKNFTVGWVINTNSSDLSKKHNKTGGLNFTLGTAQKSSEGDKKPENKPKDQADTSDDDHSDHEGHDHDHDEDGASALTGFAMATATVLSVGLL